MFLGEGFDARILFEIGVILRPRFAFFPGATVRDHHALAAAFIGFDDDDAAGAGFLTNDRSQLPQQQLT